VDIWRILREKLFPTIYRNLRVHRYDAHCLFASVICTDSLATTGNLSVCSWHSNRDIVEHWKSVGCRGGTAVAELYDPVKGTFAVAGNMTVSRLTPSATLLQNGTVLIAAGDAGNTAEIYDPVAGTFKATGSLQIAARGPTATLLPNGKVLFTGGSGIYGSSGQFNQTVLSELYDPVSRTFSATGSLCGVAGAPSTPPLCCPTARS